MAFFKDKAKPTVAIVAEPTVIDRAEEKHDAQAKKLLPAETVCAFCSSSFYQPRSIYKNHVEHYEAVRKGTSFWVVSKVFQYDSPALNGEAVSKPVINSETVALDVNFFEAMKIVAKYEATQVALFEVSEAKCGNFREIGYASKIAFDIDGLPRVVQDGVILGKSEFPADELDRVRAAHEAELARLKREQDAADTLRKEREVLAKANKERTESLQKPQIPTVSAAHLREAFGQVAGPDKSVSVIALIQQAKIENLLEVAATEAERGLGQIRDYRERHGTQIKAWKDFPGINAFEPFDKQFKKTIGLLNQAIEMSASRPDLCDVIKSLQIGFLATRAAMFFSMTREVVKLNETDEAVQPRNIWSRLDDSVLGFEIFVDEHRIAPKFADTYRVAMIGNYTFGNTMKTLDGLAQNIRQILVDSKKQADATIKEIKTQALEADAQQKQREAAIAEQMFQTMHPAETKQEMDSRHVIRVGNENISWPRP